MKALSVLGLVAVASLLCASCEGPDVLGVRAGEQWLYQDATLQVCEGEEQTLTLEFQANATLGPGATLPFDLQMFVEVSPAGDVSSRTQGLQDLHEVQVVGHAAGMFELQFYARARRANGKTVELDRAVSVNIVSCP